jgi:hypothetical protein
MHTRLADLREHGTILQVDIQQLEYARARCDEEATRCAWPGLLHHPVECLRRGFSGAAWREQARVYDALVTERRTQLEAERTAKCILTEHAYKFSEECWSGELPDRLTEAACCMRAQRRDPEITNRLSALGVFCPSLHAAYDATEPEWPRIIEHRFSFVAER